MAAKTATAPCCNVVNVDRALLFILEPRVEKVRNLKGQEYDHRITRVYLLPEKLVWLPHQGQFLNVKGLI